MNKSQHIILVFGLTLGIAIVSLLYSPLGSPQLYQADPIVFYQGVDFGSKIINAPSSYYNPSSYSSSFEDSPIKNSYRATSFSSGNKTYAVYAGSQSIQHKQDYQANYSVQNASAATSVTIGSSATGGSDATSLPIASTLNGVIGTSKRSSNFEATAQTEISPFNLNVNPENKNTGKNSFPQRADYAANQGGIDPGNDPTGDPLPLGDGLVILWLLGFFYLKKKAKNPFI